jgi:hypothetical protein
MAPHPVDRCPYQWMLGLVYAKYSIRQPSGFVPLHRRLGRTDFLVLDCYITVTLSNAIRGFPSDVSYVFAWTHRGSFLRSYSLSIRVPRRRQRERRVKE